MLDPEDRFYQREGSDYFRTKPILEVSAMKALENVEFVAEIHTSRYWRPFLPYTCTTDQIL